METIKFKRQNLKDYKVIEKPGVYDLTILTNVTESNRVTDEDGNNPRYIANFKAVAADKLPQLKETFAGHEEVSIEDTNGLFLTGNIWEREGKEVDLPMKGEVVECSVGLVASREGEEVLRVTNIKRKPKAIAATIDLGAMFEEAVGEGAPAKELEHA